MDKYELIQRGVIYLKKFISLVMVISLLFTYVGCGNTSTETGSSNSTVVEESQKNVENFSMDDGIYSGQIVDDKRNGKGKFTWKNGDVYDGEWKDNKMNGQGKLSYANKNEYTGEFVDGKKEGQGIFIWNIAGKDKYDGQWKDDKMNGQGKYYFESGAIYDGEWANNKMNGQGKYTSKDGKILDGKWENNNYIE